MVITWPGGKKKVRHVMSPWLKQHMRPLKNRSPADSLKKIGVIGPFASQVEQQIRVCEREDESTRHWLKPDFSSRGQALAGISKLDASFLSVLLSQREIDTLTCMLLCPFYFSIFFTIMASCSCSSVVLVAVFMLTDGLPRLLWKGALFLV